MQADYQSECTMKVKKQSKPSSTFMLIERTLFFDKPYEYFFTLYLSKLIIESDFQKRIIIYQSKNNWNIRNTYMICIKYGSMSIKHSLKL